MQEVIPTTNQSLIRTLDDLMAVAKVLVRSGLLPATIKTPEAAAVIILKGRELGVPMMESFALINVIAGKPTTSPQLMLGLIKRGKIPNVVELKDMTVEDDGEKCTVTMIRQGMSPHSESFSMADARQMMTFEGYGDNRKQIPLSEKYNWKQMPKIMRKWRAVAACARVVFPDLIGGLYTNEEMGAEVDEAGFIVEAESEASEERPDQTIPTPNPATTATTVPNTAMSPVTTPKVVSVDYNEGALNYRDEDGVKMVNVNGQWRPALSPIGNINEASRAKILALFKSDKYPQGNEFEMTGHLKKHFGKATLPGLVWEELASLITWKRDQHPDVRWYAVESAEKLLMQPTEIMATVKYGSEESAPHEFLEIVKELRDPFCLVPLLSEKGWNWKDDKENLINLARLLQDGTLEYGTPEFWELVKHAKPDPL